MIGPGKLTGGSGGGASITSIDEDDRDSSSSGSGGSGYSTTSTSNDDSGGSGYSTTSTTDHRIDLGQDSPSGAVDTSGDRKAVVDTGDEIDDAGGPDAVLVDNQEEHSKVNETISEVTDKLKDAASTDSSDSNSGSSGGGGGGGSGGSGGTTDIPSQAETAAENAANSVTETVTDPGMPSLPGGLPSPGDLGGKAVAVGIAAVGAVALAFGGS